MLLIGAKIQECRKRQGLSQEEFATRVGVTRQAVSKWETDKAYPDLDKLVAICDILQIGITGLVYGESAPDREPPAGTEPGRKEASAGEAPGEAVSLRLRILLVLAGGAFFFCGALFITVLGYHAWKQEDALAKRVRVERVYQQYTKADVSFIDDVSRRVVKTVWMDVNGIREGDSLICYTDGEHRDIYYGYRPSTLIVLGAVELVLLTMFLICLAECRRLAKGQKEKQRPAEGSGEKLRPVPAEGSGGKLRQMPADEAKEKEQP